MENFLGIVSLTRACGRIARLVRRPFHSSFNRKVAVNALLLFAFWAVFPSLYGFNLSGRNWAIGLPFAWITFRPNFPGLNYGGHLNFDLELAVPNLAVAFLCSVGIQKLVQIAFNRSPREGSVYLTGVFYLVALFMNPLLASTLDGLLVFHYWSALIIMDVVIFGAIYCPIMCLWLYLNPMEAAGDNRFPALFRVLVTCVSLVLIFWVLHLRFPSSMSPPTSRKPSRVANLLPVSPTASVG
jgi:hypothetical protein